eukprot:6194135-Pleurochrysis_carterae.AAC.1
MLHGVPIRKERSNRRRPVASRRSALLRGRLATADDRSPPSSAESTTWLRWCRVRLMPSRRTSADGATGLQQSYFTQISAREPDLVADSRTKDVQNQSAATLNDANYNTLGCNSKLIWSDRA